MLLSTLTAIAFAAVVLLAIACCIPIVNVVKRDDELQERMLLAWQIAKNYMTGRNQNLVSRTSVIAFLSVFLVFSLFTASAYANIMLLKFGLMPANLDGSFLFSVACVAIGMTVLVSMSAVALCVVPMAAFAALKAVVRVLMRSDSACFVLSSHSA